MCVNGAVTSQRRHIFVTQCRRANATVAPAGLLVTSSGRHSTIAAAVIFCVITRNVITRNYAVITCGRISLHVIPAKAKKEALGIWPL